MRLAARALALASLALLAACAARPTPPPELPPAAPPATAAPAPVPVPPPAPPVGRNAVATGVRLETPRVLGQDEAARALAAFRISCPVVTTRTDPSGLTVGSDWQGVCTQAASLDPGFAPGFFYYGFDWVRVGEGRAFMTGYYEPEIEGSRTPQPGYTPIYRAPPDLVRCTKPDGTTGRGRIDETGTCVLYYTRAEIDDGALGGKGLELAWAKDPVDLFFVEIQGSGRIRFEDGTVMRLAYANQNGRDYVAIGRLLRDRGILPLGGANMQSIRDWIRANPEQGRELMRENLSYVFFKELTGPGPPGALNVPVTARATVAADPNYVPLGAPVFIHRSDRREVDGLWVAQDVGGAIKGPNRFDTFWGSGAEAAAIAGGMSASGEALVLVPKGVGARALPQP
ncbi:MAG: rane-bound lytic murein transglycosylase [Sphingomonadales bacterium]|nr:rane-bound lytic murein transglycosylase [Sphingomonadales bacterium]